MITYEKTHWGFPLLLRWYGSALPRALPVALFTALYVPLLMFFVTKPWLLLPAGAKTSPAPSSPSTSPGSPPATIVPPPNTIVSWWLHPYPFQAFATLVGFGVVFRSQLAYSRYSEARAALAAMGARWLDAAVTLVAFDRAALLLRQGHHPGGGGASNGEDGEEGNPPSADEVAASDRFVSLALHLSSLLHALCCQALRRDADLRNLRRHLSTTAQPPSDYWLLATGGGGAAQEGHHDGSAFAAADGEAASAATLSPRAGGGGGSGGGGNEPASGVGLLRRRNHPQTRQEDEEQGGGGGGASGLAPLRVPKNARRPASVAASSSSSAAAPLRRRSALPSRSAAAHLFGRPSFVCSDAPVPPPRRTVFDMFLLRGDQRNIALQNAAQPLYVIGGLSTAEAGALACGGPSASAPASSDDKRRGGGSAGGIGSTTHHHHPHLIGNVLPTPSDLEHDALLRAAVASSGSFMRSLDASCCPLHLPVFERPYLVYAWLVNLVTRRAYAGRGPPWGHKENERPRGLAVEAPVLARLYTLLSDGLAQGYEGARRVTDTPFPFPWAQTMIVLLLVFTAYCPLLIACYVTNVALATTLSVASVVSYWTMNEVARELEDAFTGENALPLATLQFGFNEGLLRAAAGGCAAPVMPAVPVAQEAAGKVKTGGATGAAAANGVPLSAGQQQQQQQQQPTAAAAAAATAVQPQPSPFAAAAAPQAVGGRGSAAPPPTPAEGGTPRHRQQQQQQQFEQQQQQQQPADEAAAWLVERLRAALGGRPPSVAEVEAAELRAVAEIASLGGVGGVGSLPLRPSAAAAVCSARAPSPPPRASTAIAALSPVPEAPRSPTARGRLRAGLLHALAPAARGLSPLPRGGGDGGSAGARAEEEEDEDEEERRQRQRQRERDGGGDTGADSDASGTARVHSMLPPLRISSFGVLSDAIRRLPTGTAAGLAEAAVGVADEADGQTPPPPPPPPTGG